MIENNMKDELDLALYYDWFCQTFLNSVKLSSDEFFSDVFDYKLVSVSKNINVLFQGDEYFVTKIRMDKQHDVFFRCSSVAVKIILDECLGVAKKYDISTITELEAKVISSFNDFLFNNITQFLINNIDPKAKRKNYDMINLTMLIKSKNGDNKTGKVIISLPYVLVKPPQAEVNSVYDVSGFNESVIDVALKVGTTKFNLRDLKGLESGDMVVFENSNINTMRISFKDYVSDFKLTPNPGIVTSIDDDGGESMSDNSSPQNLWDSIQVDMDAEFDSVKISLGDLKNIQNGMVVDLMSIYDNKVSLKVENKLIARGELVIVNDRYGVKIDETFAHVPPQVQQENMPVQEEQGVPQIDEIPQDAGEAPQAGGEEEFDYSDFNLDDEDI